MTRTILTSPLERMDTRGGVERANAPSRDIISGRHARWRILRERFPSSADTLFVFVACALPVFAWAILAYLYALPGFIVRLSLWDIIGTASYPLAFALIESLILLLPFVLLAFILPPRFFKDHFVAFSTAIVIISSVWMARANFLRIDFSGWDGAQLLTALTLYALSLAIPAALIVRFKRIEKIIQAMVERVALLVYFYLGLGCLAVVIVLVRNL